MKQTVFVSGQCRCGTSLMMQMLQAGGVDCHGEFPAFEPPEVNLGRDIAALAALGKAVKLLDPHRDATFPELRGVPVIWMDREYAEQAKSQVKLLETLSGLHIPRRSAAIRGMAKSIREDRETCLDRFSDAGAEVFELRFESVLAYPYATARDVAAFLRLPLDQPRMARAVIPRSPQCQRDMALEISLCEGGARLSATEERES